MRFTKGETVLFFTAQPIEEKACMVWMLRARNFDLDQPDSGFVEFDTAVAEQDREVVESQRPEMLPVDLTEELHIKGPDAASVEYRRMLKQRTGVMYA